MMLANRLRACSQSSGCGLCHQPFGVQAASGRIVSAQRLHRRRDVPGLEAGTREAGQDVGIVAQRRAGCLLKQGSGFLGLAGIQQRHAQANSVLHGGRTRQFGTDVAQVLARVHELLGGADDLPGTARMADFWELTYRGSDLSGRRISQLHEDYKENID